MTGQEHNPIFEQWLLAYGNHLERVAQGDREIDLDDDRHPPTTSPMPKDR
jgi:hypothetical protein